MTAYFLLFGSSFLAATILPFYSEILLFSLVQQGYPGSLLLMVATAGNTFGAVINWLLGKYLLRYRDRRWFYFKEKDIINMQHWFNRYGVWSLLLAWLPLGGDVLTFIAGTMRVPLWIFLILVAIGKFIRYVAVFYAAGLAPKLW